MEASTLEKRLTVSIPEAAEMLGVSVRHAYDLAREGRLPVISLGARKVVPVHQLEKLLRGDSAN